MLRIETGLVLLAVLVALTRPATGAGFIARMERRLSRLARKQLMSVALVGVVALALRAAVLPILPIPEPIVHDEFGYLLAADTFAHGRLTNPTPPLWVHFETFHVMFHPSYASIYPPAQGLVLAAAKVITGKPFWGVWFSMGLMCSAITWMLQGWLSPGWALFGGILAILRYGIFTYWANSYWGGAVAAIGGALVLGALPRIKTSPNRGHAILMATGIAILANSRPYEGFVLTLAVVIVFLVWIFGKNRPSYLLLRRQVLIPIALVLVPAAAGTSFYFWRVTGNPLLMPYQVERRTYAVAPYFIWQPVRPEPSYHHAVMRKMFVEEEMMGRKDSSLLTGVVLRMFMVWSFYLGPVLFFPFLMLMFDLPNGMKLRSIDYRTKILLFVLITSALGSFLVNFYSPHYSAPTTGLILMLVLLSLRQLRAWGRCGLFLARAIPVICVLSCAIRAAASPLHIPLHEFYEFSWYQKGPQSFGKAAIEKQLGEIPGKHLVIVCYLPNHRPFDEWVYNDADLDRVKVVWARDLGTRKNLQLVNYFKDRHTWLLEADRHPPQLSSYRDENDSGNVSMATNSPTCSIPEGQ